MIDIKLVFLGKVWTFKISCFFSGLNHVPELNLLDNDALALELQRETEEFIKTPPVKALQQETKFVKHTYGYYSNNIYRYA